MAFFVLMGLIAILIVYIGVAKKKKRALLISVVILGMFYLYVRYTCGPNHADVKVMTPMAEAISDYIVKHGIPDSLEDISNLPYELEGCGKEEHYYGDINDTTMEHIELPSRRGATGVTIDENCKFLENGRQYYVELTSLHDISSKIREATIEIGNYKSKTWGVISVHSDKNRKVFMDNEINFGSSKADGICNPMRQ